MDFASTWDFTGELGIVVTHPYGSLAGELIAAILAVLVAVAAPDFWNAGTVTTATELFVAAVGCGWERWWRERVSMVNKFPAENTS